jgi:hypothetical protein
MNSNAEISNVMPMMPITLSTTVERIKQVSLLLQVEHLTTYTLQSLACSESCDLQAMCAQLEIQIPRGISKGFRKPYRSNSGIFSELWVWGMP